MNSELEQIEKTVGKERFSRALEVLEILGGKLPENFEIKKGRIVLDPFFNSYIDFSSDSMSIKFRVNGYDYYWHDTVFDNGSTQDELSINNDNLFVEFFTNKIASQTSNLYLCIAVWSSLKFISDTDKVSFNGETFPLDEYYDRFVSYMNILVESGINPNSKARNKEVADIIIKVYEKPIKRLVQSLKDGDQTWRFENERNSILNEYAENIGRDRNAFVEAVNNASANLTRGLQNSERVKDQKMGLLKELQESHEQKVLKRPGM